MMIVKKVEPADLHVVWVGAKPHIERAIATSRGEGNAEHIRRQIQDRKMDMFVAVDAGTGAVVACMTTMFIRHPIYTALRVTVLGGESGTLEEAAGEFLPSIKEWSIKNGATKWEAYCHPAMARLLQQKYGFRKDHYVVVTLDLE